MTPPGASILKLYEMPTKPSGMLPESSVHWIIGWSGGSTTRSPQVSNTRTLPSPSVTVTRKSKVPSSVGVPLMTPLSSMVRPIGRPSASKLSGGRPPLALRSKL